MIRPNFISLKTKYKLNSIEIHKCSMYFPNTCAIRMSEALVAVNSNFLEIFKNSGKNVCPHGYVRGAQDLAAILAKRSVFGPRDIGWTGKQTGGSMPSNVVGKKGIICYMNIPGYSGQGHIDLWNNSNPVGAAYWDAKTIWMWKLK